MNSHTQATQPPNATGRPLSARGIRACASRRAKDAIEALTKVANDNSAPTADRVRAAEVLLAHAHGDHG